MESLDVNPGSPVTEKSKKNSTLPQLNDFCEDAVLPLHCVNENGVIIWANQAEFDFLGFTRDEYFNRHISFFHADEQVASEILKRLTAQQKLVNYYARLRSKSGEIKHVLINSNAYFKDGILSHTCCFTTDITELKKEELKNQTLISQLREKNTRLLWNSGSVRNAL